MVLLLRWWGQLQAKASGPDTAPLLEDETTAVHSSQHSFVSSHEHHSRHHPALYGSDAHGEAGLIEQQGIKGQQGYQGYEGSDTSSSNRGVLPGLSNRRRPPTSTLISLHGQCRLIVLHAYMPCDGPWACLSNSTTTLSCKECMHHYMDVVSVALCDLVITAQCEQCIQCCCCCCCTHTKRTVSILECCE